MNWALWHISAVRPETAWPNYALLCLQTCWMHLYEVKGWTLCFLYVSCTIFQTHWMRRREVLIMCFTLLVQRFCALVWLLLSLSTSNDASGKIVQSYPLVYYNYCLCLCSLAITSTGQVGLWFCGFMSRSTRRLTISGSDFKASHGLKSHRTNWEKPEIRCTAHIPSQH